LYVYLTLCIFICHIILIIVKESFILYILSAIYLPIYQLSFQNFITCPCILQSCFFPSFASYFHLKIFVEEEQEKLLYAVKYFFKISHVDPFTAGSISLELSHFRRKISLLPFLRIFPRKDTFQGYCRLLYV